MLPSLADIAAAQSAAQIAEAARISKIAKDTTAEVAYALKQQGANSTIAEARKLFAADDPLNISSDFERALNTLQKIAAQGIENVPSGDWIDAIQFPTWIRFAEKEDANKQKIVPHTIRVLADDFDKNVVPEITKYAQAKLSVAAFDQLQAFAKKHADELSKSFNYVRKIVRGTNSSPQPASSWFTRNEAGLSGLVSEIYYLGHPGNAFQKLDYWLDDSVVSYPSDPKSIARRYEAVQYLIENMKTVFASNGYSGDAQVIEQMWKDFVQNKDMRTLLTLGHITEVAQVPARP